jgi:hypothetical protein
MIAITFDIAMFLSRNEECVQGIGALPTEWKATNHFTEPASTASAMTCRQPKGRSIRGDLAKYSGALPDGYWAMSPLGRGMNSYPKILRAWWPRIAEEYAAAMSGPKLAKKYGVGSTRTIYLTLEKYRREQAQT